MSAVAAGAGALAEAMHATATILWIVLPALALYEFQRLTGGIERIRTALVGLTDERRLQAILIAWFFGLFMEGAAGFGTPVALAAPLLVGLGYPPVRAVTLALLGHAAGVSFGAVGTRVLAQLEISGLDPAAVAVRTAALHALAGPVALLVMVRLAGEGALSRRDLGWTAVAAACFFAPSLALAALTGPELPSLGGALLGVIGFAVLLCRRRSSTTTDLAPILPDLTPYLVVLALVLATRLIAPVQETLLSPEWAWTLDGGFAGAFQPLYHPGRLLAGGLVVGALATGRMMHVPQAVGVAARRLVPVAPALAAMLALSRLLVHAGMIDAPAAAATATGAFWPALSPLIGVLGTFVTGSATASNILFTQFQLGTAAALSLPPASMAAAQGFGAAIGNVVAPHNIIAGSATVGLVGREGGILRRTILAAAAYAGIGGAALLLWAGP